MTDVIDQQEREQLVQADYQHIVQRLVDLHADRDNDIPNFPMQHTDPHAYPMLKDHVDHHESRGGWIISFLRDQNFVTDQDVIEWITKEWDYEYGRLCDMSDTLVAYNQQHLIPHVWNLYDEQVPTQYAIPSQSCSVLNATEQELFRLRLLECAYRRWTIRGWYVFKYIHQFEHHASIIDFLGNQMSCKFDLPEEELGSQIALLEIVYRQAHDQWPVVAHNDPHWSYWVNRLPVDKQLIERLLQRDDNPNVDYVWFIPNRMAEVDDMMDAYCEDDFESLLPAWKAWYESRKQTWIERFGSL